MEGDDRRSAEPSEDDEGWSALRSSDLRLDPNADESEAEEGDKKAGETQQEEEDTNYQDDGLREVILIDDDLDREEEKECQPDFALLLGAPAGDGVANMETEASETDPDNGEGNTQKKSYAHVTQGIFDELPGRNEVVDLVVQGVKARLEIHMVHLAPLANILLGVDEVRVFVWNWWVFLRGMVMENSVLPPTSARAAKYTKERRQMREEGRGHFITQAAVRIHAGNLPEGRVYRDLGGVFLVIEQAIDETLTKSLHKANFVKVTYPDSVSDLDVHQKRILYHLAGWMLSSALSRVQRDGRLGRAFLPFVNRHKYSSAEEFRMAHGHDEFTGVEAVVEERNVDGGTSLLFPSAPFFRFVLAIEAGYRTSLENPVLLATYHGDLGSQIHRVVSTAERVKLAWGRCAQVVPGGSRGGGSQDSHTEMYWALFEFVMRKWHNCRMHEYTRGLASFRKELKRTTKAAAVRDYMALRSQLKVLGSGCKGKGRPSQKAKKAPPKRTKEHLDRATVLAGRIGLSAWRGTSASHLREYIVECGVKPPTSMKKCDLQSLLRSLVPGIGMDSDSEPEPDTMI